MKIVIVGGGAIGRLMGASLAGGKNDVTIVDINQMVIEEIQEKGIGVMGRNADSPDSTEYVPVSAVSDTSLIKKCDLVLLTVKSFATKAAAESVAHLVTEESPIVFMQTGLGNQFILPWPNPFAL